MRIPYIGAFLLAFLLISNPVFSQTGTEDTQEDKMDKDVEKAYNAYNEQKYTLAIELLKKAFTEVKGREEKSKVLFRLAESYYYTGQYEQAKQNYQKAYKLGYKEPEAQLYYADMLKMLGEYEEAIIAYKEYKKEYPSDPRGDEGIEAATTANGWAKEPSLYQVSNMKAINSEAMDFAPAYGGKARDNNVLIFVSGRDESTGSKEDEWTGEEFLDIYITSAERKKPRRGRGKSNDEEVLDASELKWSTPVLLEEEELLNTDHSDGVAQYDSRKKILYFTRCENENNQQLKCGIWTTEAMGSEKWKQPERIVIGTDTLANIGHPSLSSDDKYLYFVSDEFNTRGRHDIFVTTFDRRARSWGAPKNLGPAVNTRGEEYYPFAHDDGYLYFSSNAHTGMGGLDIFRIKIGDDGMPQPGAKAENMLAPINSSYDDFGIIFESGGASKGFLSSNRKGSNNNSDDIYAVFKTPVVFRLEGVVLSSKTKQPIPEAQVEMVGSDGTSVQTTADADGYYFFGEDKVKEDVQYTLSFSKKKFLSEQGNTTTIGVPLSAFEYLPSETKFVHKLELNMELDPIEDPIILPNVFFDLGKWDLRPEARASLDTVVMILNNNPTITIELRSHTDYRGDGPSNDVLSQKRADTCVKYIASQGIASDRMTPVGRGENEPFYISKEYDGYGSEELEEDVTLTERYIKSLSAENQEIANQINRRTDFKVTGEDYVPSAGIDEPEGVDPGKIIENKKTEKAPPGEIYIVQGRESFGVIARKTKITIIELKKLNGGLRGIRPFEGLQLKVEPEGDYEEWDATHYQITTRGETFKSIAKKLDMDDDDLEDLNPDLKKDDLLPGLWIRIQ